MSFFAWSSHLRKFLGINPGQNGNARRITTEHEAGPRSLLVAVFIQALKEMDGRAYNGKTWPKQRIEAAKWFLGHGEENDGISLKLIAREFGLPVDAVQLMVGAEKKMNQAIDELKQRTVRQQQARLAGKNSTRRNRVRQLNQAFEGGDGYGE